MNTIKSFYTVLLLTLTISSYTIAQQKTDPNNLEKTQTMKTYLIEREIPNAGQLTKEELKGISQKSCDVLKEMGSNNIQWLHSYVTENKVYCVYKAQSKELLKEHANKGGFPANKISELSTKINPETANINN